MERESVQKKAEYRSIAERKDDNQGRDGRMAQERQRGEQPRRIELALGMRGTVGMISLSSGIEQCSRHSSQVEWRENVIDWGRRDGNRMKGMGGSVIK